jgi:hypothetical protein
MPFSQYKSLGETVKAFQIIYTQDNFIQEAPLPVADSFRDDLEFVMQEGVVNNSEFAICENLIYPILKEVWKHYYHQFLWWSHQSLNCDADLSGFPEYILARRSPLGKVVFDQPYFILVEAKQDNFDAAWGQCLAEMVAAQRLNTDSQITVYGITSNGDRWQFGRLAESTFTLNSTFYSIQELDKLFAAINHLFLRCQTQLENLVAV